eukprot:931074_1
MELSQCQPLQHELLSGVQHKSPSFRRKTIKNVSSWLQKQHNSDINSICQIFDAQLSIPITNLILDHSESVREAVLHLLLEITGTICSNLDMNYMKLLIPTIWKQLGCNQSMSMMTQYQNSDAFSDDFKISISEDTACDRHESSEDVRTLIVELLSKIINANHIAFIRFCDDNDTSYALQYLSVIHLLLNDKCPRIRVMICELLLNQINEYQDTLNTDDEAKHKGIRNTLFGYIFDDYAEYLCLSLAKGCIHQRGKIRSISLQLLSKIIEQNLTIKHQISSWITDDEKIWKYISNLMFDKMEYIKKSLAECAFTWISLLIKYTNNTANMACAKIWMLLLSDHGLSVMKQQQQNDYAMKLLQCVSFIITLCTQQIRHWQDDHRWIGIKALASLTSFLGTQFPAHYVVDLLPHFVQLIESENEDITLESNACLKLFGAFVPIDAYSEFLFAQLNGEVSIQSYLKIAGQLFTGYNAETMLGGHFYSICASLCNASFLQKSNDDVGVEVLHSMHHLLATDACQQYLNDEIVAEILWLILQVHARYLHNHDAELETLSIPQSHALHPQICDILSLLRSDAIWKQYFAPIYDKIQMDTKQKKCYYLFAALIHYCATCFAEKECILAVFCECNAENNSETVRYAVLRSLFHLLKMITTDVSPQHTQLIMFDILVPNVEWKVGKFGWKMRVLALDCLLLLFKAGSVNADCAWNHRLKLITTLQSRLDDFEDNIRLRSVQLFDLILNHLNHDDRGEAILADDDFKSLTKSIADRLDDSKDEIRIRTCDALQSLVKCLNPQHHTHLYTKIIEIALLHLDDANDALQQRVLLLLKDISTFNPSILDKQLQLINTHNMQEKSQQMVQELSSSISYNDF